MYESSKKKASRYLLNDKPKYLKKNHLNPFERIKSEIERTEEVLPISWRMESSVLHFIAFDYPIGNRDFGITQQTTRIVMYKINGNSH